MQQAAFARRVTRRTVECPCDASSPPLALALRGNRGGPDLKAAAAPFIPQAGGPDGKIWFTARSGRKIGTMTFP